MNEMNAFDRIIGYDDIKAELEELGDVLKHTEKYKAAGIRTPRGLLISGKPGIGKTLMAKCLIEASGRPHFLCRKTDGTGKFTESIRELFRKAEEAAPSVVLLDDMDKFSNEDEWHPNSDEFITIQSCIDEIDGEVFVIATANDLNVLPDSLVRRGRFDRKLQISEPDHAAAVKIVRHYLSEKPSIGNVDAELIASILNGESCAALETIINEAGIYAVRANRTAIETGDMLKACVRVLYDAPAALSPAIEAHINKIAYHEAGHALIAEIQNPGSVPLVSVCQGAGTIGGITTAVNVNDCYIFSKADVEKTIRTALGGKAAIELVFGETDMGAADDLRAAAIMATRLMEVQSFSGFGRRGFACSELTQTRREESLEREVQRYYGEAKQMLAENREQLDRLAQMLVEKKIVIRDDLRKMKLLAA